MAGLRLCGVHYRRVRWRHRGLAGLIIDGNVVRPGCAGTGTVVTATFGHHPSQRQRLSVCLAGQRLQDAELLASTGSTGDSYDNAMAESINGLYKAEVIHRQAWKKRSEVELATLAWGDWYNNRRLLERLGHIPPIEAEKAYYASIGNKVLAA